MSLLVIPLGAGETSELTLGEWDALLGCDLVLFEDADHPLATRLTERGIEVRRLEEAPTADKDGVALVVEPLSPLIVPLAKAGARVSIGSAVPPDDLTAAHGAYVTRRAAASFGTLTALMARLRGSDGCPWDAERTHQNLKKHLLEEAGEVVEAIETGAVGAELEDELGDVLLQVVFHAQLAADDGRFDVQGVADAIALKLIRRHPHVFSDVEVADADEVVRNWQAIKAAEKAGTDPHLAVRERQTGL